MSMPSGDGALPRAANWGPRLGAMLAQTLWVFDFAYWLTWVHIAMGLGVGWLVYTWSMVLVRRRKKADQEPSEEDLPWAELLGLLKQRYQDNASEHLDANELCQVL